MGVEKIGDGGWGGEKVKEDEAGVREGGWARGGGKAGVVVGCEDGRCGLRSRRGDGRPGVVVGPGGGVPDGGSCGGGYGGRELGGR